MQDIATIEKTETTEPLKNETFEETIVASGHQGNKLKRKFLSNPVTRSILDDVKKTAGSTLRDYEVKSMIKEPNSEKEQDTTGLQISKELVIPTPRPTSKEIEEMSEEELLRQYDDISNKLKHDHIKLERRV